MSELIGVAAEIAAVIGEAQARRLFAARGGTQITIPKAAAGSALAELVGEVDAQRMIAHFGHGRIDLPMTRVDIGDYLGLTIETVSRTFSKLKRSGVIALPRTTTVMIRDAEALEDLAQG